VTQATTQTFDQGFMYPVTLEQGLWVFARIIIYGRKDDLSVQLLQIKADSFNFYLLH